MHRHLPTLLIFCALAALAFASGERYARIGIVGATDLPTMPRAERMVVIREGTDFVVPEGMRFVLKGLGVSDSQGLGGKLGVKVNTVEQAVVTQDLYVRLGEVNSSEPVLEYEVPIGWAYDGGTVIRIEDFLSPEEFGRAWGYLEASH